VSGGRAQREGHRGARGPPEEAARDEEACHSQAAQEGREGLSPALRSHHPAKRQLVGGVSKSTQELKKRPDNGSLFCKVLFVKRLNFKTTDSGVLVRRWRTGDGERGPLVDGRASSGLPWEAPTRFAPPPTSTPNSRNFPGCSRGSSASGQPERAAGILGSFFFFTRVTGPRKSLSLKLSDTRVYEPQILGSV